MSLEVFWFVDNRKVLNVQDYKFKGISNGYPTFDVSLASVIQRIKIKWFVISQKSILL